MIVLNWVPFECVDGATRRAVELHRHLTDLPLLAFVTERFPRTLREELPHVEFRTVASRRSLRVRAREASARSWSAWLDGTPCELFVTDTLPLPSLAGARRLITVHDVRHLASAGYVRPSRYLLLRGFLGPALRRVDRVITVSAFTRARLEAAFGVDAGRIGVIPNGVRAPAPPPDQADAAPSQRAEAGGGGPYLLTVGHLERRKNVEAAIAGFARVATRWPGRLVIVGRDAGRRAELEARARSLGVAERVSFLGSVDDATLEALYRGCELLICPSRYEGFGMTVLEGMVRGRPVVASRIPPHEEIGGDAVEWFELAGDAPANLAAALERVLGEETRARELAALGRGVAARFDWSTQAARLGREYRALLGGSTST